MRHVMMTLLFVLLTGCAYNNGYVDRPIYQHPRFVPVVAITVILTALIVTAVKEPKRGNVW